MPLKHAVSSHLTLRDTHVYHSHTHAVNSHLTSRTHSCMPLKHAVSSHLTSKRHSRIPLTHSRCQFTPHLLVNSLQSFNLIHSTQLTAAQASALSSTDNISTLCLHLYPFTNAGKWNLKQELWQRGCSRQER